MSSICGQGERVWTECSGEEGSFSGCGPVRLKCCGTDAKACWQAKNGIAEITEPQCYALPPADKPWKWWTCKSSGFEGCCTEDACQQAGFCFPQMYSNPKNWILVKENSRATVASTTPPPVAKPTEASKPTTSLSTSVAASSATESVSSESAKASSKTSGGLGKGAFIGIGVGAGIILLLVLAFFVMRWKKKNARKDQESGGLPAFTNTFEKHGGGANIPIAKETEHYNEKHDRPPSYAPAATPMPGSQYPQYHEMPASNGISSVPASPASNPFVSPMGTPMATPHIPQSPGPRWSTPAPNSQQQRASGYSVASEMA